LYTELHSQLCMVVACVSAFCGIDVITLHDTSTVVSLCDGSVLQL